MDENKNNNYCLKNKNIMDLFVKSLKSLQRQQNNKRKNNRKLLNLFSVKVGYDDYTRRDFTKNYDLTRKNKRRESLAKNNNQVSMMSDFESNEDRKPFGKTNVSINTSFEIKDTDKDIIEFQEYQDYQEYRGHQEYRGYRGFRDLRGLELIELKELRQRGFRSFEKKTITETKSTQLKRNTSEVFKANRNNYRKSSNCFDKLEEKYSNLNYFIAETPNKEKSNPQFSPYQPPSTPQHQINSHDLDIGILHLNSDLNYLEKISELNPQKKISFEDFEDCLLRDSNNRDIDVGFKPQIKNKEGCENKLNNFNKDIIKTISRLLVETNKVSKILIYKSRKASRKNSNVKKRAKSESFEIESKKTKKTKLIQSQSKRSSSFKIKVDLNQINKTLNKDFALLTYNRTNSTSSSKSIDNEKCVYSLDKKDKILYLNTSALNAFNEITSLIQSNKVTKFTSENSSLISPSNVILINDHDSLISKLSSLKEPNLDEVIVTKKLKKVELLRKNLINTNTTNTTINNKVKDINLIK